MTVDRTLIVQLDVADTLVEMGLELGGLPTSRNVDTALRALRASQRA